MTGRPAVVPYYLGGSLQELAFRLAGGSNAGPRLFSLLGAVFAGTAMMGWLLRRGSAPVIGLACSLILLWDPLFTPTYRFARLEGWVFGFIFTACWGIRIAAASKAGSLRSKGSAIIAGACLALAGLFWASAVLLLPLVFYEVLDPFLAGPVRTSWRIILGIFLRLLVAGGTVLLMAMLPVWPAVWTSIQDLRTDLAYSSGMPTTLDPVVVVLNSFKHSPWIPAIGIISLLRPKCRMLGLCFLVALAGVSLTSPYTNRVVYLLPYLILAVALLADTALSVESVQLDREPARDSRNRLVRTVGACLQAILPLRSRASSLLQLDRAGLGFPHSARRTLVMLGLALALVWAPLVTFGGGRYTWSALCRREATSPDRIMEMARQAIGPGAARVYFPLDTYEFYYAGRKLGWKQFLFYDEPVATEEERLELLKTMDFAILPEDDPLSREQGQLLRQHGFSLAKRLVANSGKGSEGKPHEPSPNNVHGYGAYLFFARSSPVHN